MIKTWCNRYLTGQITATTLKEKFAHFTKGLPERAVEQLRKKTNGYIRYTRRYNRG